MNDRRWILAGMLAGFCTVAGTVLAHHGYADRYDQEDPVILDAVVVELQLINPHSLIVFNVRDEDGKVVRWNGHLGSATNLRNQEGWTKDTLKPGDRITIQGLPATNGAPDLLLARASRITRTDTGEEIKNSLARGVEGRGF